MRVTVEGFCSLAVIYFRIKMYANSIGIRRLSVVADVYFLADTTL